MYLEEGQSLPSAVSCADLESGFCIETMNSFLSKKFRNDDHRYVPGVRKLAWIMNYFFGNEKMSNDINCSLAFKFILGFRLNESLMQKFPSKQEELEIFWKHLIKDNQSNDPVLFENSKFPIIENAWTPASLMVKYFY